MKKIYLIFLLCFTIFCCKTNSSVLDFPSKNNSQMVFTTPCKYQNKLIPDFSIDTTSFLNNEGFCAPTSIKISLCVKNLSKQQILNLEISIETDSETIILSQKELLYIEPVKNDIMVRFESFISPEQMAHLVSKGIKSINIKKSKNETIAAFNGKKLNKKLLILSKYL